jgi:hypothetical protein
VRCCVRDDLARRRAAIRSGHGLINQRDMHRDFDDQKTGQDPHQTSDEDHISIIKRCLINDPHKDCFSNIF